MSVTVTHKDLGNTNRFIAPQGAVTLASKFSWISSYQVGSNNHISKKELFAKQNREQFFFLDKLLLINKVEGDEKIIR